MKNYRYYVYITTCNSRRLYVGFTNDIDRRIMEHKSKLIKGFTSRYNLDQLVYYEVFGDVNEAIRREKFLKRQHRIYKIRLIESKNPQWLDLAARTGKTSDLTIDGIG